jgi:hypothetical protein
MEIFENKHLGSNYQQLEETIHRKKMLSFVVVWEEYL